MRWGSTGNGSFGVGATAYNFASRDENASYYYYQEPSAPLPSTGVFGVSQPRGVQPKKPPDKRQGSRIVGCNTRASRLNRQQKALTGEVECLEVTSRSTKSKARPPLIVCSGKSVCSPTGDSSGSEDRDDIISQRSDQYIGRSLVPDNNGNDVRSTLIVAAVKMKRTNELESPHRYRTDEELEQIIRDLRDQVFQKQDNIQILKSVASNSDCSRTQKHHRKHLKNPVERMEGTVASVPVAASIESKSTNNGVLLQRPLSSSHLNRLMAETTIQMVVPAIISEAPVRTSSSNNLFSSLDFRSLRSSSSRSSLASSSSLGTEYKSSRLRDVNARSKQSSASTNTRRGRRKVCENDQYDDVNDGGESFLYLVDVDDNSDDPEAHSLSPVGPWIVDDFSAVVATDTPRSPFTCYSVSSLGSEDLNIEGGAEWSNSDLAAMSPRSRLLYFSDCADDCETSRTSQMHWQSLRRVATCRTVASEKRAKAESRPKRCSSANITMQRKPRTNSSLSGMSKQQTRSRTRKRPQSGGAVRSQGQV